MDFLGNSIDMIRVVFLLGAVLALICKKTFGVTPGGIIVPGILAYSLSFSFVSFLITMVSIFICWGIYNLFLARYALSTRWRSLALISISTVIGLAEVAIIQHFNLIPQEALLFSLVAPGLVTIGARKYGLGKVMLAMLSVTALTIVGGLVLAKVIPYQQLSFLSVSLGEFVPLTLANPFISLPLSLLTAMILYWRFGVRSGGYLIAPFLASVLFVAPIQFALLVLGVAISYGLMWLIQRFTLIIGLERFVGCLFLGYFVISILDLLAVHFGIPNYHPAPLVLITAVGVLTNDMCLQSTSSFLRKGVGPAMAVSYLTRLVV